MYCECVDIIKQFLRDTVRLQCPARRLLYSISCCLNPLQVAPGHFADLIVLNFDPLDELHKLWEDEDNIQVVFKEGKVAKVSPLLSAEDGGRLASELRSLVQLIP